MSDYREIGLGLLGLGTVGSAVIKLLHHLESLLSERIGARLAIRKIAVKDLKKARGELPVSSELLTDSIQEVVRHPQVDIVVELIGGTEEARLAVIDALDQGRQVVSANKALIALHGRELFQMAKKKEKDFLFEGAVGGGIPILRCLREAYVGNKIHSIQAIVNGTCNFILSEMTQAAAQGNRDAEFGTFLKRAQELGYAEADPTLDLDGTDAAQKLAILASLAFGGWVDYRTLIRDGINGLRMIDFETADYFGYRIKHLAIAKEVGGHFDLRVHPALVSKDKLLSTVEGVYNAFYVDGDPLGPTFIYGRGAGGGPTATAVVADIIDISRNLLASSAARVPVLSLESQHVKELKKRDPKELMLRYYLRMMVVDRPGVLAAITKILGKNQISISAMLQKDREKTKPVPVIVLTHEAKELNIQKAVEEIDLLEVVVDRSLALRIED